MPGAACRGLLVLVIERGRKKPAEATWGFVSAHVATNSARQDRDRHNAPEGAFDLEAHAGPRIKTSERGVTIQVEREREREKERETLPCAGHGVRLPSLLLHVGRPTLAAGESRV